VTKKTPENVARAIELRRSGARLAAIAAELDVSTSTVHAWTGGSEGWDCSPRGNRFTGVSPEERFWESVDRRGPDECWPWLGFKNHDGYGRMRLAGDKRVWVHRFSYELLIGPIPQGLVLDHHCCVRHCVNPAHLEPVQANVNVVRGFGPSGLNARKSACKRGHEFVGRNVVIRVDGHRECRICMRLREMAYRCRQGGLSADETERRVQAHEERLTGMVQASPVAPPVVFLPARFSDGSMGAVTRDLDVLADLAATPWNGDAA
jgi:hypothetical protein